MAVNTARVDKLRRRQIDGQSLKRLVEAGLIWLRTNQQVVNSLNVFPVPDGDTGTNMLLTLTSAYNEIKDSGEKLYSTSQEIFGIVVKTNEALGELAKVNFETANGAVKKAVKAAK